MDKQENLWIDYSRENNLLAKWLEFYIVKAIEHYEYTDSAGDYEVENYITKDHQFLCEVGEWDPFTNYYHLKLIENKFREEFHIGMKQIEYLPNSIKISYWAEDPNITVIDGNTGKEEILLSLLDECEAETEFMAVTTIILKKVNLKIKEVVA